MIVSVLKINKESIVFDNGYVLESYHEQCCCEEHYLDFSDLTIKDFQGLEFNISKDNFFNRIKDYGIELVPLKGYSIKVPGYASNNGYYSTDLELIIISDTGIVYKAFDIEECQDPVWLPYEEYQKRKRQ